MSNVLNDELVGETEKPLSDDEKDVPLTKPKNKGGRPKNPPKVKENKPRTEKQLEALQKGQQKLKLMREQRKEEKKIEASKLLLAKGIEIPKAQSKPQPVLNSDDEHDTEEEEEQIVYIKKQKKEKPKPKKKKKIIVYQDNSSSSESESESEEEEKYSSHHKQFKSQRNKKSLIKVYDTPQQQKQLPSYSQPINYFCD